jgi:transitional endoplasmic reticulum ATPase
MGSRTSNGRYRSRAMRIHLERFEAEKRAFEKAWKRGERAEAREHLLMASKYLFLAAEKAKAEKREELAARAARLGELARSIEVGQAVPTASTQDSDEDATKASRWKLERKPNVKFSDVAGLEEAKEYLKNRVINPMKHPEIGAKFKKRPGGGLLLYGPPGTGKTMLGKAIANEIDASFFSVRCSDVISKWVGESEKNIRGLFEAARAEGRAVIFLDEVEALIPKRGGQSTVMNRVVPEFLSQLDGIEDRDSCLLLVGATNRPWDLDEAALRPGRFDGMVYVSLPNSEARRRIFEREIKGVPLAGNVDLASLASALERYSGADIKGICEAATDLPFEREVSTGEPQKLTPTDLQKVIARRKPSVTEKALKKYESYSRA